MAENFKKVARVIPGMAASNLVRKINKPIENWEREFSCSSQSSKIIFLTTFVHFSDYLLILLYLAR